MRSLLFVLRLCWCGLVLLAWLLLSVLGCVFNSISWVWERVNQR